MENDIKKEKSIRGKHTCFYCYSSCIIFVILFLLYAIIDNEFILSNYIAFSVVVPILAVIGFLIFYFERKAHRSDLSKITTEYKPEGIVITDALSGVSFQIWCILIVFVIVMILSAVAVLMGINPIPGIGLDPIQGIIAIVIIIAGMVVGMIFILRKVVGMEKIRKFSISENSIELSIPPRPLFHVDWIDFDTIKIEYKRKTISGRSFGGPPLVISYYKLNFLGKDFNQKFKIESGKDFHAEKVKEVFNLLKNFAFKKNKGFIGPGEKHM